MRKMRRVGLRIRTTVAAIAALLAITLIQSVDTSRAVASPSLRHTFNDPDLGPEGRILDNYVDELSAFDKKTADLGKKASLTSAELSLTLSIADDLTRRSSSVQNALQEIIRKLKTAGRWEDLDARVLATITDSQIPPQFRSTSFKRELENGASNLNNDAKEIKQSVEILRNKVKADARQPLLIRELELHAVRVAYVNSGPSASSLPLRCRLAWVRFGISGFVYGKPSGNAIKALENCRGSSAT